MINMNAIKPEQENNGRLLKQSAAAAAAVALALKAEQNAIREYPLPPRVSISAWQAVLRSNTHSTRGSTR